MWLIEPFTILHVGYVEIERRALSTLKAVNTAYSHTSKKEREGLGTGVSKAKPESAKPGGKALVADSSYARNMTRAKQCSKAYHYTQPFSVIVPYNSSTTCPATHHQDFASRPGMMR
jgi:hypothetical protein